MYEQWHKSYRRRKNHTELDDDGQNGNTNDKTKLISYCSFAVPQRLTSIPPYDIIGFVETFAAQSFATTKCFKLFYGCPYDAFDSFSL